MGEPTQELMLSIMQKLQAGSADMKRDIAELKDSVGRIEARQQDDTLMITQALGLGTGAVARSRQALEQVEQVTKRVDELAARVSVLESQS